jgi:transcriptional regulator with XRE-family HTH domain
MAGEKLGSASLASVLKRRRDELGMSRRQLADDSGLSYPYISQLETAARRPSPTAMAALAQALDIEPRELFDALDLEAPPTAIARSRQRAAKGGAARRPAGPALGEERGGFKRVLAADPVRAAIEALESVPVEERLDALGKVQAAVMNSVVQDLKEN